MDIKYGFGLPERDRIKGVVPVYASSGIVGYHNASKVKNPSIIIGRKGNVGTVSYSETESYPIDTVFYVDKAKAGFNLKYLYYLLQRINLPRYGGDSAVPGLSRDTIYSLGVQTPKIDTQDKIASILSAHDAKIKNNNAIIKNLETIAQIVFDEWFVNFRFPGYEKAKFIDSEMGEIPEEWEIKDIKDVFTVILGGTPSREKPEYWNGNIPWINSGEVNRLRILGATEYITDLGLRKSNARLIKSGATVLAITGATLGQVSRLEIDSTANQSVVGIFDEENILNEYLYLYISNNILDLISGASGGAQQHINKQMVENYKIIIPPEQIITGFNKKVISIFLLIKILFQENISLKSQRDQLLAKLI
jgi:type I restriction enzyme S subunit